jgi:hypothetical protein
MNVEHYTKTLLHELWHIHQQGKGGLKDKGQKRLWKGIDYSQIDYDDQPWEQEAHQMEDILFEKYQSHLTNSNFPL